MPTIYKPEKKKHERQESSKKDNLNHKAVYNTKVWKVLRLEYLKAHTLCEDCLLQGKYILASEVHHKIPISNGQTIAEKKALGYAWDNLKSLCDDCHKSKHKHKK